MEDLELKYVTELAQMRNIINNNCELAHYITIENLDLIGAVSVSDYSNILCISKRTIQDRLKKSNMNYIELGGIKFPCVNI